MTLRFSTIGLIASFCLVGCGHTATNTLAQSPSETPASPHAATFADSSGYGPSDAAIRSRSGAAPAAAPAAPMDDMKSASAEEAAPASRPGLGTSWGESVESRIHWTSFTRANEERPDATASFFYNDESGVTANARGRYVDYTDSVTNLAGGALTVSLTDGGGHPLRAANIDGRTVAVGADGDRYILHLDNHTPFRVEAVATVDGLDVVSGAAGSLSHRGYIISPHDSLDIEGFRDSEGTVRAFRFGSVKDSYASRRGSDRNVGVVGVAVFAEQGSDLRWTNEELDRRSSADPFPGTFAPSPPAYRVR
jgi:hypothetical protein